MSDLSPEARGLVDDGLSVLRPSSRDRARVTSALASRLGTAAFAASKAASALPPKAAAAWHLSTILAGVGAGLAAIGATYWLTSAAPVSEAPVKPPAVAVSPAQARPVTVSNSVNSETPARALTPEPTVVPQRKQAPADQLAEEIAILSKATSALRAGKAAEGLKLLEEHQRKFPHGRLAEERRAARIQALCALGKREAAEAELARLAQSSPRSPHLARAQRACGITP